MKPDLINYALIGRAQLFYKGLGYVNLDTPWLVSPEAILATLPKDRKFIQSNFGCLVGSGEQSFIQMMLEGTLMPGKYQTTTPCFRDETEYNDFTRSSFFKTELIWYKPEIDLAQAYDQMMSNAMSCMFEISNAEQLDLVQTSEGFDIQCNGIEVGSYGVRQMGDHTWVFGTGVAEPRFTLVVERRLTPEILVKQRAEEAERARLEHEAAHRAGTAHHEATPPIGEQTSSGAES
jgi:hypothetical protein